MARVKQIAMAAGTFSVALGIGFVMQNGDALASRFGNDDPASVPVAPEVAPVALSQAGVTATPAPATPVVEVAAPAEDSAPLEIPMETPTPVVAEAEAEGPSMPAVETPEQDSMVASAVALPEPAAPQTSPAPVELAAMETDVAPTPMTDPIAEPETAAVCDIGMTAEVAPAAFVDIAIDAPCYANTPFVVHHQGMMFTVMTDDAGHADIEAPALAEVAVFIAAFPDGEGNVVTASVPDFANYDRAVLQWQGDTQVMLSAYEFGAVYGEDGHVSRENARTIASAVDGDGGFLVSLGDARAENAMMAEVYTFPSGTSRNDGQVVLSAEAEITAGNCGNDIAAQSIQVFPDGNTMALDLAMTMPECDAVGDFLILQNMFEDLTLASR